MQWHSVGEFLAMGGYGFYVWVSFGVSALCLAGEIVSIYRRSRRLREPAGSPDSLIEEFP